MNINESNFAKDYIHKNTFMTNKRFHRDEYPFDILGEFGLTENMIYDLPDYVHENIEMGGMSPLLPISIKQPFGSTHCYAKFCLIEVEDGIDVLFSPKLKEADLSNFLKQDRQLLLEGKTIVSEVEEAVLLDDGTENKRKVKAFVQLDKETNSVVYAPTQIIGRNLQTVTNEFDLSESELQGFWKGELVTTEMSDEDKVTANITIGIDLFSEKGVVLIPGGAAQWKRVVHKSMPEYNFGNDGCWVNRHGMLEYVPEENFTQDILEALERQARQSGIPKENLQNISVGHTFSNSEANDDARQITR